MFKMSETEDKMKEFKVDADREQLLEDGMFNLFNQYNMRTLVKHMKSHIARIKKCDEDKDQVNLVFGGKYEMTSYVHHLTLQYLRGIRAFHLKNFLTQEIHDPEELEHMINTVE